MTDTAGGHLEEEPQSERGPMGSRDTGSDEPSGGPLRIAPPALPTRTPIVPSTHKNPNMAARPYRLATAADQTGYQRRTR